MTKRTKRAYVDVFNFLKLNGLQMTEVMSDYELAMRSAVKFVFPHIRLWGCFFHYSQVSYILNNINSDILQMSLKIFFMLRILGTYEAYKG